MTKITKAIKTRSRARRRPGTVTEVWSDPTLITAPISMNRPTPKGAVMIPTVIGQPDWPGLKVKKWGGKGDGNKNTAKRGSQQRRRKSAT